MEYVNRCVKFCLPNGNVVDILESVITEMLNWLQNTQSTPEGCGFLMGYNNKYTQNITLSALTTPQRNDERTRFFCKLRDKIHFRILSDNRKNENYYMGVWHTHPQEIPSPSLIDWNDWYESLIKDNVGAEYAFFIIAGICEFRVWAGEKTTGTIVEIFEAEKVDSIYL